jgi:hypothetical protein
MPTTTGRREVLRVGDDRLAAGDLDDPRVELEWVRGSYEIVEGVLTTTPPANYVGGEALSNLVFILRDYLRDRRLPTSFPTEADIVIDEARVAKADVVYFLLPRPVNPPGSSLGRLARGAPVFTRPASYSVRLSPPPPPSSARS